MRDSDQTRASLLSRLTDDVDRAAWLEFYSQYADLILGFARTRGLQPSDCEDVLQDVLVSLVRSLPQFEYKPELGRFRGYLKTVTMNSISKKMWQKLTTSSLEEDADVAVVDPGKEGELDALWEAEWRRHHVRRAMRVIEREFSERDRAAFSQYVLGGASPESTAEGLGMTVNQVYQAKSRILKRLSGIIEQQRREED